MIPHLRLRLSVHMFLSGAVIGVWTSAIGQYFRKLGFNDLQISLGMACFSIAAMVSSLPAGQIADRWLSSEKLMALLSAGAASLLYAAWGQKEFVPLWLLLLGAAMMAAPVIPLGTAMSFRHLSDAARHFPLVRVWATIGWVWGAWSLSGWQRWTGRGLGDLIVLSAAIAGANAIYSLSLPRTPPTRDRVGRSAAGKAIAMLRDPGFAFLTALLFTAHLFSAFFYGRGAIFITDAGVPEKNLSAVMSAGQIVEIFMVFALPFLYTRLGAKGTIALGIAAWAARFSLFTIGHPLWLMVVALSLHGVCFACGRIAATIYVDTICERDARASAQSLLSLTVDGAGMVIGNLIAWRVAQHHLIAGKWQWAGIWLVPAIGCGLCFIAFLAGFRARRPAVA